MTGNDLPRQKMLKEEPLEANHPYPGFQIKDKGYAMVPVYAMFVSNAITSGYINCFGIIFTAIKDLHPEISMTMAGVMMGLLTGFRCIFSPVGCAVANIIGIRLSMFIGTTLCFTALVAAFFCSTSVGYAISLGAVTGLGHCIIESTHVITLSNYFDKKLAFANGIRVAGSPFGSIIYPLILAFLLQVLGTRLMFLILAALNTQIYICTALTMPINVHLRICGLQYVKQNLDMPSRENLPLLGKRNNLQIAKDADSQKKRMYQELMLLYPNINNGGDKKKKALDFSYLKNPVYLLFIAMGFGMPILPLLGYYTSIYAKEVVGLSIYDISIQVSVQSVIDVILRLAFGYLNNRKLYKLVNGYMVCLIMSVIGSIFMPFTTGFYSVIVAKFLCSIGYNAYHTFVNVILCDQFGAGSIATTYGFVRMTQGIFSLIHPAIIGYIVDLTGGFMIPYFLMGSILLFSCLAILVEPLVIKLSKSNVIIT